MKRNPKGRIVTWVIVAVLAVGVLGFLLLRARKAPELVPVAETPGGKVQVVEKGPGKGFAKPVLSEEEKDELDNEAMGKALRTGAGCAEILYDEALRQTCEDTLAYDAALKSNDEALCAKIKDEVMRTNCLDRVAMSLAIAGGDAKLCDKIKDSALAQQCKDRLSVGLGRTAESSKDCEGIADEKIRQACLDNFYFASSMKTLSEGDCDVIVDGALRDRCQQTLVKTQEVSKLATEQAVRTYVSTEETLQDCGTDQGATSTACRDQTNFNLAQQKKDLKYCQAIIDSALQQNCLSIQSASINNYYLRLATSRKDPSLCEKILDAGLKATCITYAK